MITYNGIIMAMDGIWIGPKIDPYNPLNLPPYTVRVRTSDGKVPSWGYYETATLVAGTTDVWDVYSESFSELLSWATNVVEVLGANTSNVTNMYKMFNNCTSLTTVPLFDTSNVTDMSWMFSGCDSLITVPLFNTSNVTNMSEMFDNCPSLTTVPLFDTSSVTNMSEMFDNCSSLTTVPLFDTSNVTRMSYMLNNCTSLTTVPLFDTSNVTGVSRILSGCTNVESGALALYNQMSTQTTPPSEHWWAFHDCGSNTTTGAAELAQIPSDWK